MERIAYLMLAHDNPKLLERVAIKLTGYGENHMFIHVDKKSNMDEIIEDLRNYNKVHIIEKRISVNWGGGTAQLRLQLDYLRQQQSFILLTDM